MNTKCFGEKVIEFIDNSRLVERTMLLAYGFFAYDAWHWVKHFSDPSATVATIFGVVLGLAGTVFAISLKKDKE